MKFQEIFKLIVVSKHDSLETTQEASKNINDYLNQVFGFEKWW